MKKTFYQQVREAIRCGMDMSAGLILCLLPFSHQCDLGLLVSVFKVCKRLFTPPNIVQASSGSSHYKSNSDHERVIVQS